MSVPRRCTVLCACSSSGSNFWRRRGDLGTTGRIPREVLPRPDSGLGDVSPCLEETPDLRGDLGRAFSEARGDFRSLERGDFRSLERGDFLSLERDACLELRDRRALAGSGCLGTLQLGGVARGRGAVERCLGRGLAPGGSAEVALAPGDSGGLGWDEHRGARA